MSMLSIKHIYGIRTLISNSIYYVDEHCYLYPSSRHIILYNNDYKCQRLINYGNEYDLFESLCVSPNKQYICIGLNTLDKCRIIIYDISGTIISPIKRKKILSLSNIIRSNHIISIVFSSNSKFFVALFGASDYVLVCWTIDQFKYLDRIHLHFNHTNISHHPINIQVSFNPIDSSKILITGNHIFRQYYLNNDRLYPYDHGEFQKYESLNITCHCWLNQYDILLGIDKGFMLTINKSGYIIQQYNVSEIEDERNNINEYSISNLSLYRSRYRSKSNINIKNERNISIMKSNSQLLLNKVSSSLNNIRNAKQRISSNHHYSNTIHEDNKLINSNSIICLLPFSRGVFVSIGRGYIIMYERSENSCQLTYLRKLMLPTLSINDNLIKKKESYLLNRNISMNSYKSQSMSNEIIQSLSLSPNEETLLIGTNQNNLYEIFFSKMDYTKKEKSLFKSALDNGHYGNIIYGSISISKPILYTLGIDRYIKIWNLQTNNQELNYQFVDEPLFLSVHPTGLFISIGFFNILRIYVYTIDGLILFKQLKISNIRCIEYSNQGHMLVILYDNIIELYNHIDYDIPIYKQSNEKKFRLICWSNDDTFIITVDFSDLIIQWNPYTGQRLSQYQIKDFSIEDLLISSDNKYAYILTSEKKIKEFLLMTSIRDINIPYDDCIPTSLSINERTQHLFIGSQNGSIYSIKLTQTNSINHDLLQTNVHQGSINKILISYINDLVVSMGEDGNIIIYNLNDNHLNKESKRIFRDEILVKQDIVKEQNIEYDNLIKHEYEMGYDYKNKIEIKEKEYIEHLNELDIHCQLHINSIEIKLKELNEKYFHSKKEHQQQLNKLIENKKISINQFIKDKTKHYHNILLNDNFIKLEIENFQINHNHQIQFINHLYKRHTELIHLSYRDKINFIKNTFYQKHLNITERINYLEEVKYTFYENLHIELNHLHEFYINKLKLILNKIEQLENEEVLFKIRFEQLEEESNHFQDEIKQFQIEQNQLINHIKQIDYDLNLAKQTIQQRHFIIQEKLKRTNQMENRRDELEKFAYVFNYKIRELTNQIGPRQHELKSLIQQFNNMDNEYNFLNENNEKYSIKINHYKSRLRAIEKQIKNEIFYIRKLNQTAANINEDLKLSCHFIDQPKQLIKFIRKIYSQYILYIHTNMNIGQMNIFDSDRQRNYFERNNQRLQGKILYDIKREKIEEIRRFEEQISMMREISSYSLKVIEIQRILSDLDIVSIIVKKTNVTTSNDIIHALKLEQDSHLIQQKQYEFYSILNKQEKRIQHLRNFIQILEKNLQNTSDQCGIKLTFNFHSNYSIDHKTIISSK